MMTKIYQHSGTHLFLLFWRASHAVMRYDESSVRRAGFRSLSDFAVLEVLLQMGALPVNAIGEKVLLTSGSITTAVDRLEQQALVKREKSELDRRLVLVRLTEAGRERITRAFAEHAEDLDQLFAILDDAERVQFAKLTRKLGVHAEKIL